MDKAQAWLDARVQHRLVPGTRFVSGQILCSVEELTTLLRGVAYEAQREAKAEVKRLRELLLDEARESHWNESGLCGPCTQRSHSLAGVPFPCTPYREALERIEVKQ